MNTPARGGFNSGGMQIFCERRIQIALECTRLLKVGSTPVEWTDLLGETDSNCVGMNTSARGGFNSGGMDRFVGRDGFKLHWNAHICSRWVQLRSNGHKARWNVDLAGICTLELRIFSLTYSFLNVLVLSKALSILSDFESTRFEKLWMSL